MPIRLTVNGDEHRHEGAGTVAALLDELGARGRVAVVVNDEIIPAARRGAARLRDGDRVDVLTLAAGG